MVAGSRSSAQKPVSDSRLLYAGRRLFSIQVSNKLLPENELVPGFDDSLSAYDASTEVQGYSPF